MLRTYIYGLGLDEVLMMTDEVAEEDYYYLHDHLASPLLRGDLGVCYSNNVAQSCRIDFQSMYHLCHLNFVLPLPFGICHLSFAYPSCGNTAIACTIHAGSLVAQSRCANPYYFTGRRLDVIESGTWMIQYHRNRFYDYKTGRWLNQDPIGYQDGVNLYEYVGSSPMNRVDPMGTAWYDYVPGVGTIVTCWEAIFGNPPGTKVSDYASAWEIGGQSPVFLYG